MDSPTSPTKSAGTVSRLSRKGTGSTTRSKIAFTPESDLSSIGDLINGVRHSVIALTQAFESLEPAANGQEQHGGTALKLPQQQRTSKPPITEESTKQIHALRKQLVAQDKTQETHILKIKELIRQVLMDQITNQLRKHLREMVREHVGKSIRDRIAEQLAERVPAELAHRMQLHREEVHAVRLSLHNAEARRSNSMIRSYQLSAPLQPLLKDNGDSCPSFPASLVDLFALPVASVITLMDEYGLQHVEEDPREANLNKIMQFIGVTLQMVPAPPWAAPGAPPLITSI